ncbi:flagellar assembly peptidoglycan hydrolase FlgJ [Pseudoalteromonas sp. MM17-2]|uniref:flagellar assembly peptidoglycan hydrolase FlgJ n=1 Tax=Pseudoalteromonas sp. MM17-2 TaxID=2917753 RepID=UPI001EF4DABB|nr:flagellar assembly peptidoglycan hydrolase FlgJ [Pseudoalteromonas sp. MM17-2]MCG7544876.1 flagellar assembly peptidoglycan hydrolase FlgJ [Pseudoalteromonas sp. MM17-2]
MDANQLQTQSVFDLNSLDKLRQDALKQPAGSDGERAALKQAAQQFESIFTQMLLKSMRKANEAFEDEDSPFNASSVKYFQDMHDQQLSSELSANGSLGLADLIVQQLSPQKDSYMPASALRDARLNNAQVKTQEQHSEASPIAHKADFANAKEFVEGVWDVAREAAGKIGVHPGVMVAQAALETGWGKHIIKTASGESSNNLFNIKAHRDWQGEATVKPTLEYEGGVAVQRKEPFRVYDSIEQSFDDFVSFLKTNPRYQQALDVADKPHQFIDAIHQAGYATDPQYAEKIKRVLGQSELRALAGDLLRQGE